MVRTKRFKLMFTIICVVVILCTAASVILWNVFSPDALTASMTKYTDDDFSSDAAVWKIFGQTLSTKDTRRITYDNGNSVGGVDSTVLVGGVYMTQPSNKPFKMYDKSYTDGINGGFIYGLMDSMGNDIFTVSDGTDSFQIYCFDYYTHFEPEYITKYPTLAMAGIPTDIISEGAITDMAKVAVVLSSDNFEFMREHADEFAWNDDHISNSTRSISCPVTLNFLNGTSVGSFSVNHNDVKDMLAANSPAAHNAHSYILQYMIWSRLHEWDMPNAKDDLDYKRNYTTVNGNSLVLASGNYSNAYFIGGVNLCDLVNFDKMYQVALDEYNSDDYLNSRTFYHSYSLSAGESITLTGSEASDFANVYYYGDNICSDCLSVSVNHGTSLTVTLTAKEITGTDHTHTASYNTTHAEDYALFDIYASDHDEYRKYLDANGLYTDKGKGECQFTVYPRPIRGIQIAYTVEALKEYTVTVTKDVPAGFSASGAVYTIYSDSNCTSVIDTITIGSSSSGSLTTSIDNCYKNSEGKYYVWIKETSIPTQAMPDDTYWLMDTQIHQVEVTPGGSSSITSENLVKYTYGYVQVHKKVLPPSDEDSNVYSPQGAVYNVYENESTTSTLLGKLTIGADGYSNVLKIAWPEEDFGKNVYVKEISPPSVGLPANVYWVMDDSWHTVEVKSDGSAPGDTVVVESSNSYKYCYGYVRVHKLSTPNYDDTVFYSPQGAVYRVYSEPSTGSTVLGELKIGANEYSPELVVSWGENETGKTVYIKEYSPPDTGLPEDVHWVMDDTWHTAYISSDGTKPGDTVTVESRNALKYCYGYVQVHKAPTPRWDDAEFYSPQGAVYRVYSSPSTGSTLLGSLTIGADEYSELLRVSWSEDEFGKTVYIKEYSPPPDDVLPADVYWVMDNTWYTAYVHSNGSAPADIEIINSVNSLKPCYGYVQVHKLVTPAFDMSVYYSPKGAVYKAYETQSTSGKLVGSMTIGDNDHSELLRVSWPRTENGKTVYIKEYSPPPSNVLPADVHWTMDENWYIAYVTADGTHPGDVKVIESENALKYCYGYVQVYKEVLPAPDDSTVYSPVGAVYRVYSSASTGSQFLGSLTIGDDGYSNVLKIAWPEEDYGKDVYIKEYSPPTSGLPDDVHWVMDNTWHTAAVSSDGSKPGDTEVVSSTNHLKYCYGYVSVYKSVEPSDAEYLEGNYSPEGAIYGVYSNKACTSLLGRVTIKPDGYSDELKVSWEFAEDEITVYVKEISPPPIPPGLNITYEWAIDATVYPVLVKNEDNLKSPEAVMTYSSDGVGEYGYFQLRKTTDPGSANIVEGNSLYTLEGTEFKVVGLAGTDVESYSKTFKTDADGLTDVVRVKLGTYIVTETKAPSGYQRNNNPLTNTYVFEVHLDNIATNPVITIFENIPVHDPLDIVIDKDWAE